jgi:hypothetical protein
VPLLNGFVDSSFVAFLRFLFGFCFFFPAIGAYRAEDCAAAGCEFAACATADRAAAGCDWA